MANADARFQFNRTPHSPAMSQPLPPSHCRRRPSATLCLLMAACAAAFSTPSPASGQAGGAAPEVIYWRQNLLTVPYQWNSTAGAGAAKSVWLYVSKDRGTTWQQVGDAQPQLLAFNYRAASDGEYWFAIRTTDANGRDARVASTPGSTGGLHPELCVIVDTTMPRFESLTCQLRGERTLEIRWRVADANLAAHACNLEFLAAGSNTWQPVPLASATELILGTWDGVATLEVAGAQPITVRATVTDLAGNRALYQSSITPAVAADSLAGNGPQLIGGQSASPTAGNLGAEPGWVASSAPSPAANRQDEPAEPQLWPADQTLRPEISPPSNTAVSISYGVPLGVVEPTPAATDSVTEENLDIPEPVTDDRPLGNIPPQRHEKVEPLQPFRQVSMTREIAPFDATPPRSSSAVPPPPANPLARLVNSRTFALEYELAEVGSHGVSKVELWGTRDGGATWRVYAVDSDNRSPLQVTIDGEGEYGFSIVVESAGGMGGYPPQPGDTPELWISVDLQPPQAQIISVNTARSTVGGELVLNWESDDDNLEARPVSLFYSSRPAGPWTTIATNLESVGEFSWPLERHVPRRIYLKLEARDTAGNVAVYQTGEAVTVESDQSLARVQRLPPVD